MLRRKFIALCGAGVAAWPLTARGSRPACIGLVSGLNASAAAEFLSALRDGLAAYGYFDPGSVLIDKRFADNVLERIPALIEEFERRHVDVIVTHGAATGTVVKSHRTIPVVYEFSADPVASLDVRHVPVGDDPSLFLEQLHVIREELHVVAVDLHGLVGGSFHHVVLVGQRGPRHVQGFGKLAASNLRLRARHGRSAEPIERDGHD